MSTIESIIKGGSVEPYKYRKGSHASTVACKVVSLKERMKKKKPVEYFKGLIPSLVQNGYLQQDTVKSNHQFAVSHPSVFPVCVCKRVLCCCHFPLKTLLLSQPATLFSVQCDIQGHESLSGGTYHAPRAPVGT